MKNKKCRVCGIEKPTDKFYKSTAYADGRSTECIECESKRKKTRRQPNSPNKYVGQVYPRTSLTILAKSFRKDRVREDGTRYKDSFVEVECRCGVKKTVAVQALKAGFTTACVSENCEYSSGGKRHKSSLLIDDGDFFINKSTIENFKEGAKERGIYWDESLDDGEFFRYLYRKQNGKCAYSGVSIPCGKSMVDREWSPQRVDSDGAYVKENLVLVHTAINVFMNCYTEEGMDLFVYKRFFLVPKERKQRFENMIDEQVRDMWNSDVARIHDKKKKRKKF